MNIRMVGIDHNKASVEYREQFALTKSNCIKAMEMIKELEGVKGCVILSTCNRTEIWISHKKSFDKDLNLFFCNFKGLDYQIYKKILIQRDGLEAVRHLFDLSCGVKSKVFGEDQIITQVKDALVLSRDYYCTDNVLEVLFRMAITAAKKVKTNVKLSHASHSVVEEAITHLENIGIDLKNKVCMVIGNGEMGKLSAMALKEKQANVTVTVRQYKSGIVEIPFGCNRINYGERMEYIKNCDIVMSATASPNCTIKFEELKNITLKKPLLLVDLAVPRDIDPNVATLNQVKLYDIDDFKHELSDENRKEDMKRIEAILTEQMEEFVIWYECRDIIPEVKKIAEFVSLDITSRMKGISKSIISNETKESLDQIMNEASKKSIEKLLFGLRDQTNIDTWRESMKGMLRIYSDTNHS